MTFSIWFFVWLFVSAGLLGFSVWTFIILMRQKKSWRDFAKKNKLRFRNTAFMSSPRLNGVYKNSTIGVFTSEHESERGGANRKMTAIEVELESAMPISGAVASGGMVSIVQQMDYSDEYVPTYSFWNSDHIARCDNKYVLAEYLSEDRAKALSDFMGIKNFWVIFIFRGQDTILRVDTPDPFDSVEKLTKTIDKMIEIAGILELNKGESKRLTAVKSKRYVEKVNVDIEEDDLAVMALELEDDEEAVAQSVDGEDLELEIAADPEPEVAAEEKGEDTDKNSKKNKTQSVSEKEKGRK